MSPDEPRFLKDPPPGPDPTAPREPRAERPPTQPPPAAGFQTTLDLPDGWTILNSPEMVLAVPPTWRPQDDPRGLAWDLRDERGRKAEVFLHVFGFEKKVPEVEVYVETQREMLHKHSARTGEDRRIAHGSKLPAHLLTWSSIEPTGDRWSFHAGYLRAPGAIYVLKLDQAGEISSQLAREHELAFGMLRPK